MDTEILTESDLFIQVKSIDLSTATVSLYVVHRKMRGTRAEYTAYHVNSEENLRLKLRKVVQDRLSEATSITEYDYLTTDQDDGLLSIDINETDFARIINSIEPSIDVPNVISISELANALMYIIRLDTSDNITIYAARRVSNQWTIKKIKGIMFAAFIDGQLRDLKEEVAFRVDKIIDFFSFRGKIFIANKKNFETALNFREGIKRHGEETIREFAELQIVDDPEKLKTLIGDSIPLLRRLAKVRRSEYYHDDSYMDKLREVAEEQKWRDIKFNNKGQPIVEEDTLMTLLTLLNDDRMKSYVIGVSYDVEVKHPVES